MLGFKNFLMEEDGVGVVEMVLILSLIHICRWGIKRSQQYAAAYP